MYRPSEAKEVEPKGKLEPDHVYNATIIHIDGAQETKTVKDFVENTKNWRDEKAPCIQVNMEVEGNTEDKFSEVRPYSLSEDGETMEYTPRSWFGKFKTRYGKLPEVGMVVKYATDKNGFGAIKVD